MKQKLSEHEEMFTYFDTVTTMFDDHNTYISEKVLLEKDIKWLEKTPLYSKALEYVLNFCTEITKQTKSRTVLKIDELIQPAIIYTGTRLAISRNDWHLLGSPSNWLYSKGLAEGYVCRRFATKTQMYAFILNFEQYAKECEERK